MSTETATSTSATPEEVDDRSAAYKEAAIELGKGIALGLVPFLGQAIDVYDTIESSVSLYRAQHDEDKENAQFDLLLAIVGWIPGPGDGIKKSLRIVNKDPDRFAPVLFDLLRFVLQECGVHTSPEALLDEVFNAGKLSAQLGTIIEGIKDASAFEALPQTAQTAVLSTLQSAQAGLPLMVGVVEKRLRIWKKKQPNSSANRTTAGRAKNTQPGATDAGTQGHNRAANGGADEALREQAATLALAEVSNEMMGVSGEHIADYICAYKFGWGNQWRQHDDGAQGKWAGKKPGKETVGKLSKGKGKTLHALYKLNDGANGTGIDAVWRATEGNNGGKPYAIVEAKASRDEDAPKFMRRIGNTRKPSITSKLGVNGIGDPSELLEPLEDDVGATKKGGSGKANGKAGKKIAAATPSEKSSKGEKEKNSGRKPILVQMSHEWIQANLAKAIGISLSVDVLKKLPDDQKNYFRHLFFSPLYHPSGSPKSHLLAKQENLSAEKHSDHDAFHYEDSELKKAVNKRKSSLRKKHGALSSLKEEK